MNLFTFRNKNYDGVAHAELTNTSRIITKGPVLISNIFVNGDGVAAQVDIYDGLNNKGRHVYRINCIADDSKPVNLSSPIDFDFGIYVVVNAATTYVTIAYHTLFAGNPV